MSEIYYLPKTILEILENSDHEGRVNWTHCLTGQAKESCLSILNIEDDVKRKHAMACYMFGSISLYNHREEFVTLEYLNKLDPKMVVSENKNYCYFSANASIACGMLGLAPKQEIKDLYNFLQEVKKTFTSFYENFDKEDCDLHLILEKKSGSDLLSGIKFSYCGDVRRDLDEPSISVYESFLEKELGKLKKHLLSNRNVLSWYMFNQKILNKTKYSKKMLFTSESFFEREENPYFKRFELEREKIQIKPIQPIEDKYLYFIDTNYSVKKYLNKTV